MKSKLDNEVGKTSWGGVPKAPLPKKKPLVKPNGIKSSLISGKKVKGTK